MPGPFFDAAERAELGDLFEKLGPDAPTLLAPWTTRDLAAHLLLRDRDYLAGPGLVLPGAWGRFAEQRRRALARRDFGWLTATIRSGRSPASVGRHRPDRPGHQPSHRPRPRGTRAGEPIEQLVHSFIVRQPGR